jgi:hypothetical protein
VGRNVTAPLFSLHRELARHVTPENRLRGNRAAVVTFLRDPREDPRTEYLSVNSLEVESPRQIAKYYQQLFQQGTGEVAVFTAKVFHYNEAGKKCGVDLQYDQPSGFWTFGGRSGKREPAYRHRPGTREPKSPSHCGVEFVRAMNEHVRSKFARRLATRRFHIMKV